MAKIMPFPGHPMYGARWNYKDMIISAQLGTSCWPILPPESPPGLAEVRLSWIRAADQFFFCWILLAPALFLNRYWFLINTLWLNSVSGCALGEPSLQQFLEQGKKRQQESHPSAILCRHWKWNIFLTPPDCWWELVQWHHKIAREVENIWLKTEFSESIILFGTVLSVSVLLAIIYLSDVFLFN